MVPGSSPQLLSASFLVGCAAGNGLETIFFLLLGLVAIRELVLQLGTLLILAVCVVAVLISHCLFPEG